MKPIKLYNPSNSNENICFKFELSRLEYHCNLTIEVNLESQNTFSEKHSVHINELIKIAQWIKNMPSGNIDYDDLFIPELNLRLYNYFFEKGDGVYNLTYTSENDNKHTIQLWEQIGNSNTVTHDQLMDAIARYGV